MLQDPAKGSRASAVVLRRVASSPSRRVERSDDPAHLNEISNLESTENAVGEAWEPMGPFGIAAAGAATFSGRVLDIEVDFFGLQRVAAATGGLWDNGPGGWTCITETLNTQVIGSFDTDPFSDQTIIVGTGEPALHGGTGVWRTTDLGQTWTHCNLVPEPNSVYRVRYSYNGTDIFVAAGTGFYLSQDGGWNWLHSVNFGAVTEIARHPVDYDVVYVTVHGQGLYKSSDGGASFSEIVRPGLPDTGMGRGSISISGADPDRYYVAYADGAGGYLGVYRSTDGGLFWSDVSPPDYMGQQGWYDNVISASPRDPDLVLAGGIQMMRSTDGGSSWSTVASPHLHADQHHIVWSWIGNTVWVGNDGGGCSSSDGGATWTTGWNTFPITQYYHLDVGLEDTDVACGGTQDNGIVLSTNGGATWNSGSPGTVAASASTPTARTASS